MSLDLAYQQDDCNGNLFGDEAKQTRIEGTIPANLSVNDGDRFLFISKDQRSLTHGLHKYPAKFFPELPRWIIERYTNEGDMVLDPFCGSGTTNLEALLLGRNSMGVDVDEFAKMVARTKTMPLDELELTKASNVLRDEILNYDEHKYMNGIPSFPYRDNWFKPYILREMAYIKTSIELLDTTELVKRFFLVCFSSIVRQVSEADNNCTRTVIRKKLAKQVKPHAALNLFIKKLDVNVDKMIEFSRSSLSSFASIPDNADARKIPVPDEFFDLAVTSPPYLNAVDYPRTHQLEMYWLGLANGSLRDIKSRHVGTEVVFSHQYSTLHETGCASADQVIEKIYDMDKRRAFIASKFIKDMIANLVEVRRTLKDGGRYALVIGNNLVRGIEFETWRYLADHAPRVGYTVDKHFVSAIINHFIKVPRQQRINDDHVIILKKI